MAQDFADEVVGMKVRTGKPYADNMDSFFRNWFYNTLHLSSSH